MTSCMPHFQGVNNLVHARLVLLHLTERLDVLARVDLPAAARRLAGPGAVLPDTRRLLDRLARPGPICQWGGRAYQALRYAGLREVAATAPGSRPVASRASHSPSVNTRDLRKRYSVAPPPVPVGEPTPACSPKPRPGHRRTSARRHLTTCARPDRNSRKQARQAVNT